MSIVIDFASARQAAQRPAPAVEVPASKRGARSPASPEKSAKTAAKTRLSLDANKTSLEVMRLSFEVGNLKGRIAALLDEYDSRIKAVTGRVEATVRKMRDEAHVNIEGEEYGP